MVERVSVQLWVATRSLAPWIDDSSLSAEEQVRRADLRRPDDRDRFTLGALMVRGVGGQLLAIPRDQVPVDRTCPRCGGPHGAPRILGCDKAISLAHSGDVVALAMAPEPVGVDVEALRPIDHESLLTDVLAPGEREPPDTAGFFAIWTAKEAYLKALGRGLAVPMPSVVLGEELTQARMTPPWHAPPARLARLALPDGHVGAVAVLGGGVPVVEIRDAADPLGMP